jgi:hypothetical protein
LFPPEDLQKILDLGVPILEANPWRRLLSREREFDSTTIQHLRVDYFEKTFQNIFPLQLSVPQFCKKPYIATGNGQDGYSSAAMKN